MTPPGLRRMRRTRSTRLASISRTTCRMYGQHFSITGVSRYSPPFWTPVLVLPSSPVAPPMERSGMEPQPRVLAASMVAERTDVLSRKACSSSAASSSPFSRATSRPLRRTTTSWQSWSRMSRRSSPLSLKAAASLRSSSLCGAAAQSSGAAWPAANATNFGSSLAQPTHGEEIFTRMRWSPRVRLGSNWRLTTETSAPQSTRPAGFESSAQASRSTSPVWESTTYLSGLA
mmetsp:Transcript_71208/g.230526  ORF Transcript_71208/g.230526 Transcript_71208/m.230526 type:complete len:231 (-) Transcript_71208:171-863(-)